MKEQVLCLNGTSIRLLRTFIPSFLNQSIDLIDPILPVMGGLDRKASMESQKTRELNLADEFLLRISQADPDQQADALAAISAWMDGQKAGIAIPEPAPDAFAFVAGETDPAS